MGRELTKIHQEFLRGTAAELAKREFGERGEFTIVVGPGNNVSDDNSLELVDDRVSLEFWQLTNKSGLSRRAAVSQLARKYRRSSRDVYSAIERGKNCGE